MIEILRAVTREQIDLIAALATEIWREHYTAIIGADQVNYMLSRFQSSEAITSKIDSGELAYFLVYFHRQPAGYFAMQVRKDEVFLSKLYIKASRRQCGLAKKVVGFIKNVTAENCLNRISLTINKNNTASRQAYEKMGFKLAGEVVNDIGNGFFMDDYVLELLLPGQI